MTRPRSDGSAERALAIAFLALALLKLFGPALQLNGARLTGAVMPSHTSHSSFEAEERVDILSIGGDRRVLWGPRERVAALHLLVALPTAEVTVIDRPPSPGGSPGQRTIEQTYRIDGGAHRGAVVRVAATYDPFRRTATIDGVRYRLSRGNLFVVRMDHDLRPAVVQLGESFSGMDDPPPLLHVFHSHVADAKVRRVLSAFLGLPADPPARPRDCSRRAKVPTAAT